MTTKEELRERLNAKGVKLSEVSKASGIKLLKLWRWSSGKTEILDHDDATAITKALDRLKA